MAMTEGGGLKDRRVLIAEDSMHIALVLETALEAEGMMIVGTAPTLEEACALARSEKPDFAVVDLRLGDESALPLVRQLSEAGTKTVVATGYELTQDLRDELGEVALLGKPYTPDQLLERLRALL